MNSTWPSTSGPRGGLGPTEGGACAPIDDGRIARLFAALSIEYGPRWNSQFQTEEALRLGKAAWWGQIADLTDEEIRRALDAMDVGPGAWPPGPRAFRKLAVGTAVRRSGAHVLLLPEPPPTPEQREAAKAALAKVLEQMGGARGGAAADGGPRRRPVRGSPEQRRAFVERHRAELEAVLGPGGVAQEIGEVLGGG